MNKAAAQSNYVQHGDSGNYSTIGLPKETTLDGKVSLLVGSFLFNYYHAIINAL